MCIYVGMKGKYMDIAVKAVEFIDGNMLYYTYPQSMKFAMDSLIWMLAGIKMLSYRGWKEWDHGEGETGVRMYQFSVLWKDEIVADVSVAESEDGFKSLNYIRRYTDDVGKQPFGGTRLDLERVYEFLESRWFERGRPDVPQQLQYLGLSEYNPWEIVKKTHGVMFEDFIWVRFEGENLIWRDVKIRG